MTTLDDIQTLFPAPDGPRPGGAPARKCRHPKDRRVRVHFATDDDGAARELWHVEQPDSGDRCEPGVICGSCYRRMDAATSRRNRNNRKRGISDELTVARILGGRKVGPLGHAWDVEIAGYMRAQSKKLASWPSMNQVIEWLDAIPAGPELRAVTLADAPGHGRVRRLIVMDLAEFSRWHGHVTPETEDPR